MLFARCTLFVFYSLWQIPEILTLTPKMHDAFICRLFVAYGINMIVGMLNQCKSRPKLREAAFSVEYYYDIP